MLFSKFQCLSGNADENVCGYGVKCENSSYFFLILVAGDNLAVKVGGFIIIVRSCHGLDDDSLDITSHLMQAVDQYLILLHVQSVCWIWM